MHLFYFDHCEHLQKPQHKTVDTRSDPVKKKTKPERFINYARAYAQHEQPEKRERNRRSFNLKSSSAARLGTPDSKLNYSEWTVDPCLETVLGSSFGTPRVCVCVCVRLDCVNRLISGQRGVSRFVSSHT